MEVRAFFLYPKISLFWVQFPYRLSSMLNNLSAFDVNIVKWNVWVIYETIWCFQFVLFLEYFMGLWTLEIFENTIIYVTVNKSWLTNISNSTLFRIISWMKSNYSWKHKISYVGSKRLFRFLKWQFFFITGQRRTYNNRF